MIELTTIETPEPIRRLFESLFAEVAAAFGCANTLGKNAAGTIVCTRTCTDCKLPQIRTAYQAEKDEFVNKMVRAYAGTLMFKPIFRRSATRHQRALKRKNKPTRYEC